MHQSIDERTQAVGERRLSQKVKRATLPRDLPVRFAVRVAPEAQSCCRITNAKTVEHHLRRPCCERHPGAVSGTKPEACRWDRVGTIPVSMQICRMPDLWNATSHGKWRDALDRYDDVITRQGVTKLAERDAWYRTELPKAIASRAKPHVTLTELVKLTEWKMSRGEWRARNLVLVRGNEPASVIATTAAALSTIPHPTKPISEISKLDGVGPATASAVAAATAPETYPFFDELVAAQVPGLGTVAWTLGYYARYAVALRERAARLGNDWTAVEVERALWANCGGKAGSVAR